MQSAVLSECYNSQINTNMRCIEMLIMLIVNDSEKLINTNMRCIEIMHYFITLSIIGD